MAEDEDRTGNALIAIARSAFGMFFVGSAVLKFFAAEFELQMMRQAGFDNPIPLYIVAAAAQLVGGMALMINRKVRAASIGLALYVLVINMFLHNFWTLEDESFSLQFQLFTKNIGIIFGLLALAGTAPRERWKKQQPLVQSP